jgi:hypothetical protein
MKVTRLVRESHPARLIAVLVNVDDYSKTAYYNSKKTVECQDDWLPTEEFSVWASENLLGGYNFRWLTVVFENDDDALLFKLSWFN